MREWQIIEKAIELGIRCDVKTWLELKKLVLVSIPSNERKRFSTRDPATKSHSLNSFERELLDNYRKKTGVDLEIQT